MASVSLVSCIQVQHLSIYHPRAPETSETFMGLVEVDVPCVYHISLLAAFSVMLLYRINISSALLASIKLCAERQINRL